MCADASQPSLRHHWRTELFLNFISPKSLSTKLALEWPYHHSKTIYCIRSDARRFNDRLTALPATDDNKKTENTRAIYRSCETVTDTYNKKKDLLRLQLTIASAQYEKKILSEWRSWNEWRRLKLTRISTCSTSPTDKSEMQMDTEARLTNHLRPHRTHHICADCTG